MNAEKPVHSPYLIGLTGRIGSGKSLVRGMLERLGALGLDADRLAHDCLQKGSPAHAQIVAQFGRQVLDAQGEIDRPKLAGIVFADAQALQQLEACLHPCVSRALQQLLQLSPLPLVALEAIKLYESGLAQRCQSVWLVQSPAQQIHARLSEARGMTAQEVEARLAHQAWMEDHKKNAQVVIANDRSILALWQQVLSAWQSLADDLPSASAALSLPNGWQLLTPSAEGLSRARTLLRAPAQAGLLAALSSQMSSEITHIKEDWFENDDLLALSLLRFWLASGLHGQAALWQLDHFCLRLLATTPPHDQDPGRALRRLIEMLEAFSRQRLCSCLQLPASTSPAAMLADMGYELKGEAHASRQAQEKAGYNVYIKMNPPYLPSA